MKRTIILLFLSIMHMHLFAQNIVKGVVIDSDSELPLNKVILTINTKMSPIFYTSENGVFVIRNLPKGNYVLTIRLLGYESQRFPLLVSDSTIDLGRIFLYKEAPITTSLGTITLTDEELNEDDSSADTITGLLQATKDPYLKAAAYDFSSSFFRIRGLNSENATVLINGISMNKMISGRPSWSNWGGLNDATRNQEFNAGLSPSANSFGGLLGVTNINIRASEMGPGTRLSYASSNRSYRHRVMATYNSGILKNNWSFGISASKRIGDEGYNQGTSYDAASLLLSLEKKLTSNSSVNISAIYAPNIRGKSSANTQEVFNLKGTKYNSYWGFQNGKIRNSREKRIIEPILMLNHYWNLSKETSINTNIAYQFGEIANSRIDYNGSKIDGNINNIPTVISLGGTNPDPTYYQKLPSYALKNNASNVYEVQQDFLSNGQLNWNAFYRANSTIFNNRYAAYVLYEDRNDNKQITVNTLIESQISSKLSLNAKLEYKNFNSSNFAKVIDLFGASKYLDVDPFANTNDLKQNDALHPFRNVTEGDKFKHHYLLNATAFHGFLQGQLKLKNIDLYTAISTSKTKYQREGLYKNGKFRNNNDSYGKSDSKLFKNYGVKAGVTIKFTGRHLIDTNIGYITKAPTLKNSFSNPRIQNQIVDNLVAEEQFLTDISYIYRGAFLQFKSTAYFAKIKNATEVSFYYADGIGGSGSEHTAFVQEILTNISQKHIGFELGLEAKISPTFTLKSAGNFGQYIYDNNPILSLNSEDREFQFQSRKTNLKNYKVAAGPQIAYSFGFEYRAPNYWWFGTSINFFDGIYIDVAPITRTSNFNNDNGIPFNDYDPLLSKKLLEQERFKAYNTINMVGGKSWKIHHYYVSLFANINNLFNTQFKTGGFEQSRNANFRELRDDKALKTPIFGGKYWYGRGTSFFINLHVKF